MLKTGDKLQKLIILIVTWASLLALFIAYERYFVSSQQTFLKETGFHGVERLGRELDAQIRRAQISSTSFVQLAAGDNPLTDEKLAEFLRIYFKDTWAGNHNEQIRNASIQRAKECLVRDNTVTLDSEPKGLTLTLFCTDRASKDGAPAKIELYTLDLVPWISRAMEPLGGNFDEVLIADASSGEVVFQKSADGPRVANLRPLLTDESTPPKKPTLSGSSDSSSADTKSDSSAASTSGDKALQKLTDTSFYLHTALGSEGYELFAVPVRVNLHSGSAGNSWNLAVVGLQRSSNFDAQSHAIPYSTLIWVTLIAAAVFSLSWPVAKLRYMGNTERFTPREGWLLVLTIFLAATSVTLLLLNATYATQAQSEADRNLANLARQIKLHFATEMTLAHSQLAALSPDEQVTPPTDKISDYLAKGTQPITRYPYFEIAFWVDRNGRQTRKFDIRPAPTPVVYVGSLPFFTKALPDPEEASPASEAAKLSGASATDSNYYLDPGISPTTAEFTPVLSSAYTHSSKGEVVRALVVRPMSLIDPVLPPGYGFAVIDSSCAVLFHSESFRDMKENFCQESKGTSELKPWLFGGIDSAIDISYAGQPERAFISPMNIADMNAIGTSSKITMPQFASGAAYLVVFRTADYALTLNLTIMVVCSILLGCYIVVILLLITFDISLRGPMQLITAPRQMWPCSENSLKYVHIFLANSVLIAFYWLLYLQLYEAPLLTLTLCLAIFAPLLWFLKLSCETKVLVRTGASLLVISLVGLLSNFIRSVHLNDSASWDDWWRVFFFTALAGLTAILLSRSSRSHGYLARKLPHVVARATKVTIVRYATTYSLAILTVITATSVVPCVGCFKFAYDMISETALKHDEIMLSKALLLRQERIHRYYLDLIPAHSHDPSDADPYLRVKQTAARRARETLDRYDIASSTNDFGFTYANEPGIKPSPPQAKKLSVQRIGLSENIEKVIGNAVLHFPANNLGSQMSKLGVAATNDLEIASDYQFDEPAPNMFTLSWNLGSDLPSDFRVTAVYPKWGGFFWWGYGLTLLLWVVLGLWLTSLVRKIFLTDVQPPSESTDFGWTSASDVTGNYLVLGLAESGKTRDLLSIPGILPEDQIDLRLRLKSLTSETAFPNPSSPGAVVVVDHFEFNLNDPKANLTRLALLEHLLYETDCRILLVSSVDPLFFLTEGAPGVITDPADTELSRRLLDRWARVLCNFQKVRVGSGRDIEFTRRVHEFIRAHRDHRKFALLVKKECNPTARLRRIGIEILDNFDDTAPLTRNLLISLVLDRAAEYYHVLWSGLTSGERLVLYQLALDGWANPKNTAALQQLESKLLIRRMPMFRIMNMSFRRFVGSPEHVSEIEQWQSQQKRSTWRAVRLMLVGLFLILVVWLLHSQAALSQELTAYVAGIATLVTAVSTLFTRSEKVVGDNSSQT
jgi:hypothetical protein